MTDAAWYSVPAEAALARLGSRPAGLADAEARKRLDAHGPNRLPAGRRRGPLFRFILQFHNVFIYALLASAAITLLLGHLADTLVIVAVVLVNAVIGAVQEGRAEDAIEAIRDMLAPSASVLRDGVRHSVPAEELVPGDVVLLDAGDKVPADLRLLAARGLTAQEAVLTGESVPVDKAPEPVAATAALGDRSSMAFSGTLIAAGQATGVVVATGAATEIGRISGLIGQVETLQTPLVEQMGQFARWLTALILLVSGLLLAYGYAIRHQDFGELFMFVVGLAVAAIPEGLPAVMTITLAIGVQEMARRNAIVRRLPAIETIGSVSVICTDKTGTLTLNEMAVATAATSTADYAVAATDGTITRAGAPMEPLAEPLLAELARAALLCNDASLAETEDGVTVLGDPMEGALRLFARNLGLSESAEADDRPRSDAIPFDARHRFMATLHRNGVGSPVVYVKGAPERVLGMCSRQLGAGGEAEPLDPQRWHRRAEAIAAQGQRVLALASKVLPDAGDELAFADVEEDLVLIGLVGLMDPPRPEAVKAVAECRAAGIQVKMITGDHASTARAIGRMVGLERPDAVLTGFDLESMDDAALREAAKRTDVFARTSPEHKLRLVMALQAEGEVVAMTGDGVNDAPALKRADAGIAMGRKGSDAAKEAAKLVLADDNFASIAAAVRQGRTVYDNVKKVISFTLPTSTGEAATVVAALLFGLATPVTAVQILWVNLITTATLDIALAFEPTEDNTMRRPPRPRDAPLLSGVLAWQVVLISAVFLAGAFGVFSYALERGYSLELARTMALNTLVVMEIFNLFFIRNLYGTSLTLRAIRGTPVIWMTVGIVTVAQFAITYLPPLQAVFQTEAVPLMDGLLIIAVGAASFAIAEIEKQLRLWLGWRPRPAREEGPA